MTNLEHLIDRDDARIAIVRPGEIVPRDGGCVLLWVQRAQRASGNHAANVAIELGNELRLPVVAAFCLVDDYPRASYRAYRFMAEGLAELPAGFAARGAGWTLRMGDPAEVIPQLAREGRAVAVISDLAPTRPERRWKESVAGLLDVPMALVDADVVIPTALTPNLEWAPRTIRPKLQRHYERFIAPIPEPAAAVISDVCETPDPIALIDQLQIDRSVPPSPTLHGGQAAARARLDRFLEDNLHNYDVDRNRAHLDRSSRLSPWLHYGQISPVEIAWRAQEEADEGKRAGLDMYLDELIVQRELAINFALHEPNYDRYEGLPDWGRKTLDAHRHDPRPHDYSLEQLEAGATHDRLWNAAQRQLIHEGYLPNRLRMYWAKQLPYWTRSPEEAFEIAMTLNDRYFVDGRDAAGYAGIAWSIGGRHDRPFPPNKPVLGLVRPMGMGAMKRTMDVDAYISTIESATGSGSEQRRLFG